MEDDVQALHPGLPEFLCKLAQRALRGDSEEWEILQLDFDRRHPHGKRAAFEEGLTNPLSWTTGSGHSTGMYLLQKDAAKKLIRLQLPIGGHIRGSRGLLPACDWPDDGPARVLPFCSSVPGEGGAGSLRPFSSRSGVPKTLVWPPEESSQRSEAPQQYYACKVLHKAEQDSSALRAEIKNLRMLDHPNVVRLYEVNEDAEAVFLLMEYCCGGDLFSLVTESHEGRVSEKVARSFAEQMLSALAYCHSMGIVHRDVKPENFLLEGIVEKDASLATLKLADFGIATHIRCAESHSEGQVNGSVPYMAPELFTKRWSSLVRD
eukprot:g21539.t1